MNTTADTKKKLSALLPFIVPLSVVLPVLAAFLIQYSPHTAKTHMAIHLAASLVCLFVGLTTTAWALYASSSNTVKTHTTGSITNHLCRLVRTDAARLASSLFDLQRFGHELRLLRQGEWATLRASLAEDMAALDTLLIEAKRTLTSQWGLALLPLGLGLTSTAVLAVLVWLLRGRGDQGTATGMGTGTGDAAEAAAAARTTVGDLGAVGECLSELATLSREMWRLEKREEVVE